MSQMSIKDFKIFQQLGEGAYGSVHLAQSIKDQKMYAIKILDKQLILAKQMYLQLRREIEIQSRLNHKHILGFHGYFHDDEKVYIVLEYASNGALCEYIQEHQLSEHEVARLATAVEYMRVRNVMHRGKNFANFSQNLSTNKFKICFLDLKLENILLTDELDVKIADFGCVVHSVEKYRDTICGTLEYLTPELVNNQQYDFTIDQWALGILMYEMLFKKSPFHDLKQEGVKEKIKNGQIQFPDNQRKITKQAKDLIQKFLDPLPNQRIKYDDLLNHPFLVHEVKLMKQEIQEAQETQ